MKITRDGKTYELTHDEMLEAYWAGQRKSIIEDIITRILENEMEEPDVDIDRAVEIFEKQNGNNDWFWSCYWSDIDDAIKEATIK